jgi:transposase, IS30 family
MSYVQLTLEERFVIYHLRIIELGVREIARRLNRHHSTRPGISPRRLP